MPKLPRVRPREVIKALEKAGFVFIKQVGTRRVHRIAVVFQNFSFDLTNSAIWRRWVGFFKMWIKEGRMDKRTISPMMGSR